MAQPTPVNPTIFVQIPLHNNIMVQRSREPVSLEYMHTNRSSFNQWKKRVAWDDVTKRFLFHKAAILPTCSINLSIGILNM